MSSKLSAGVAGLVVWFLLITIVSVMAAATKVPVLTFHKAGKTMTIRASDIVRASVAPQINSELSYIEYELTAAMGPITAAFMSGLTGRKIAGFVDGITKYFRPGTLQVLSLGFSIFSLEGRTIVDKHYPARCKGVARREQTLKSNLSLLENWIVILHG